MTPVAGSYSVPPLVLLHGATASGRVWDPVIPFLGSQRRILTPTLAGHLGGPLRNGPPAKVIDDIVDAMCRHLDEAGVDAADLVGNSLGGWVALELARRGRARSVLAISPAGAWRSPRHLTRMLMIFRIGALMRRNARVRRLADVPAIRRVMLRTMAEHADRMSPSQVVAAFEDMEGCSVLGDLLAGARAIGPMAAFTELTCPVRIAWGWKDRMLPFMNYGAPMVAALPGTSLVILPGVGHVPMVDDPALVARTINDFVEPLARWSRAG